MILSALKKLISLLAFVSVSLVSHAQFLMDITDTSRQVHFSGYIQPQFQVIQQKGASSFNGGDFPEEVNNRFALRRGRMRMEYVDYNKLRKPSLQFVFQFDGTEKGVFIRDFWGRVFESKMNVFSFTTGMFARPFGFEVNLGSADRESPERGRMSQLLMKTERDLGIMGTFEPREKSHPLYRLELDAGFFNGQGMTSIGDFDSYKDFISRLSVKPDTTALFSLSGGLSYLNGGILQNSRYINRVQLAGGKRIFSADSSINNIGKKAPRIYYGADIQGRMKHRQGATELRAEYWQGTQTALEETSETPSSLPSEPYYIRNFNGGYFYLLHRFRAHQLGCKFDWYDPNTRVKSNEIGQAGANINDANILYKTLGFGYLNYINKNLRLMLWYEIVKNEETDLEGYREDLKDNVFTCRLQYKF